MIKTQQLADDCTPKELATLRIEGERMSDKVMITDAMDTRVRGFVKHMVRLSLSDGEIIKAVSQHYDYGHGSVYIEDMIYHTACEISMEKSARKQ